MKRFFANLNIIKHVAQTNNLEIVPSVFPVGYANDLLYNSPNLIEGLPVTNTLLVVSNNLAPIQPSPPVAFPSVGFSDLSKWSWYDNNVAVDNGSAHVTFEQLLAGYPAPTNWWVPRLRAGIATGQPQLVLKGERGQTYSVLQSSGLSSGSAGWSTWTNIVADDATLGFAVPPGQFYRAACQR